MKNIAALKFSLVQNFWLIALLPFFYIYRGIFLGTTTFTHDAIQFIGMFHYFAGEILHGVIPLWNPYISSGTPFIGAIQGCGYWDPCVLLSVALMKVFSISSYAAYIFTYLLRATVFFVGTYVLFKHLLKNRIAAQYGVIVLLLATFPPILRQNGLLNAFYLAPFSFYWVIRWVDDPAGRKSVYYLILLILAMGVAANIYIPSYFYFNLFWVALIRIIWRFKEFKSQFMQKPGRIILSATTAIFLVVLLMTPALILYRDSTTASGELFPTLRMLERLGAYKKVIVSELPLSFNSEKFTNRQLASASWGNMLNLIYPSAWRSFFAQSPFSALIPYTSETSFAPGITVTVLAMLALFFARDFTWVLAGIMFLLNGAVCFNPLGSIATASLVQKFMFWIFPPIRMIQGVQTFTIMSLLFWVLLAAKSVDLLINNKLIPFKKRQQYRFPLSIFLLAICFFSIICEPLLRKSTLLSPEYFVTLGAAIGLSVFFYLYFKNIKMKSYFLIAILLFTFVELYFDCVEHNAYVIKDNHISEGLAIASREQAKDFGFFRTPYPRHPIGKSWQYYKDLHVVPMQEAIFKEKGIWLQSLSHDFFQLKRYYDLLGHLSKERQFEIFGVTTPILEFYPESQIERGSKAETFVRLENGAHSVLETSENKILKDSYANNFSLKDSPSVEWLWWSNLENNYDPANFPKVDPAYRVDGATLTIKGAKFNVENFTADRLQVKVSNDTKGVFIYKDGWSRYWRAFKDGIPVPILKANYAFKGIELEAGSHEIIFEYFPAAYIWGLSIYFFFIALLSGTAIGLKAAFILKDTYK